MAKFDLGQDTVLDPSKVILRPDMYKLASEQNLSFSQLLERINPSKEGQKLDAFERQLQRFGIVTKSNVAAGIYATSIDGFLKASDNYNFENQPLQRDSASKILFPEYISKVARAGLLKDTDYDMNNLIGSTRIIQGTTFKDFWIDQTPGVQGGIDTAKYAMGRTTEFGTFPRVKVGWAETAKSLYKRGVQIDMSYEFQREASMDILNLVIDRIMMSQRIDLFKKAMSIAYNGTSAVESSTLDALATGGVLTYEAWLKWTASFAPYSPDTYYMHINTAIKVIMMDKPNIDPVAIMASLEQGPITQNIQVARGVWKNVTIWPFTDTTLPEGYILTLDKRFALERIVQAGTDLQETEKIITQQFDSVVISISDEISKVFTDSIFILHITA
jgi:hypothetical protein